MASRHQTAQLPAGTHVQERTTKSNVNRDWHKGEYKALAKAVRLHKGTSAQQESVGKLLGLLYTTTPVGSQTHNSPPAAGKKFSCNKPTPLDSPGLSSHQITSGFPKALSAQSKA